MKIATRCLLPGRAQRLQLAAVLALILVPAASRTTRADPPEVGVRMRHVMMQMGYGASLRIDDLRGHLQSRTANPPTFDDVNSYTVVMDYARTAVDGTSLTNLMNNYVFAAEDAPIKKLSVSVEGNELVQSGTLKKGVPIPFKMRASIAVTPDGRLRMHPTSLKAAGFVSKRVLDFFGLELERMVSTKTTPGVAVDGDDLLLDPRQALPPPKIGGKLTNAWMEDGRLIMQFGAASAQALEPPKSNAANYMYYRGGILKFGRLTMVDADLLLVDADPRDLFRFDPRKYQEQLVAGYSKTTRSGGLIVHMPDAGEAVTGRPGTTS
jgi:hypothetical protein